MSGIWFEVHCAGELSTIGRPHYIAQDYSFDFFDSRRVRPLSGLKGTTSLLIGTLQLELDIESSYLQYVWGYSPESSWSTAALSRPTATIASIKARGFSALVQGVSIGIEDTVPDQVWFDRSTGWVCIGIINAGPKALYYEFATDTIACIVNTRLVSLWILPEMLETIA